MKIPVLIVIAFIAIFLFVYFRNKQAQRNDDRRERLQRKQEELMEMLRKNKENDQSTKDTDNDN